MVLCGGGEDGGCGGGREVSDGSGDRTHGSCR